MEPKGKTVCPKTLNEYLIAMRSLLNWMERCGHIATNPLKTVSPLPTHDEQVKPRRAFSDEEMGRLLAASGERAIVYVFAAMTGLRRGEIAALRVSDLDLDPKSPKVIARARTTKNRRKAILPLNPELVLLLRAYLSSRTLQSGDLLFGEVFPRRFKFSDDREAAKIPYENELGEHVDFHSLRHTFCTSLQRGDTPQRVLMELMRHSDRRLSDHLYTSAALLDTRGAVDKLPGFAAQLPQILPHGLVQRVRSSPFKSRKKMGQTDRRAA